MAVAILEVAAITGALLGAQWGASAIRAEWTVDHIDYSGHGVPPTLVRHPLDDGVWLADASALGALPDDVTAVVSLCLVGRQQIRPDLMHSCTSNFGHSG